jgi:hypothetical protein
VQDLEDVAARQQRAMWDAVVLLEQPDLEDAFAALDVEAQRRTATGLLILQGLDREARLEASAAQRKRVRDRYAPELTLERATELERKFRSDDPGEPISQEDAEEWSVAIELSQPECRGHVDEDGLWQIDDDSDKEWDAWYDRPIAESLFERLPNNSSRRLEDSILRAPAPVAAHHRGTSRAVKNRGGSRSKSASRGDPDPEPPLTRLQLWRLAISEAVRVRVEQIDRDYRECASCLLDVPRGEFRPGRRVCSSCEDAARSERRQRQAVAA